MKTNLNNRIIGHELCPQCGTENITHVSVPRPFFYVLVSAFCNVCGCNWSHRLKDR